MPERIARILVKTDEKNWKGGWDYIGNQLMRNMLIPSVSAEFIEWEEHSVRGTLLACQALLELDAACRTEEAEAAVRKAIREVLA